MGKGAGVNEPRPETADEPKETVPQEYYRAVFGLEEKPVPADLAEDVARWCVFVGDQLGGSLWLIVAARVIRLQAAELRAKAAAPS